MDFDEMAYPDEFDVAGIQHKGRRDAQKGEVLIPYSMPPNVKIGDLVIQDNGPHRMQLQVLDTDFKEEGSLGIGTRHPHMLALKVTNNQTDALLPTTTSKPIHIGSLTVQQVQIGDGNSLAVNITVQELARQVAESGDAEAKGLLRQLLENNSVAAVIGAGASALL